MLTHMITHTHSHKRARSDKRTHAHLQRDAHTDTQRHTCTHTHAHTYIQRDTHTHTHRDTGKLALIHSADRKARQTTSIMDTQLIGSGEGRREEGAQREKKRGIRKEKKDEKKK